MKKPLKVAATSGLVSLILSVLVSPLFLIFGEGIVKNLISLLIITIGGLLAIFFLYGFVVLGDKFKNTLLSVMAWIGIVFAIILIVFGFFGNLYCLFNDCQIKNNSLNFSPDSSEAILFALLFLFLFFWILIILPFAMYSVLFGIGLNKLENKTPYARTAGILNIIAGATYFIIIGFFIGLIAYIFEIAVLFKASEKYESKHHRKIN